VSTPSDPGASQPSDPWQTPPYGQPTPPPYGGAIPQAPRYDEGQYGHPPYGAPTPAYANWGLRVGANLIDFSAPYIIGGILVGTRSYVIGYILEFAAIVWGLYNAYQAGVTGQSTGRRIVGIRLIDERTGGVLGAGTSIGRYFLHILDAIPCWLGFLWPLWDAKRQTWADKLVHSVVIKE
jgi:uncharacterized RDD family membrane protein YckC